MPALPLVVHPTEQAPAALSLTASLTFAGSDSDPGWLLQYQLMADMSAANSPLSG